jgi:hypothetical protein
MKFLVIFFISCLLLVDAFAHEANSIGGCNCANQCNQVDQQKSRTITSDGVTVNAYYINGLYYINGMPIGNIITTGSRDGVFYINNMPIKSYVNNFVVNNATSDDGSALYLQAFTKFSLKDYREASKDCKSALKINPKHPQAIVLCTVVKYILDGTISDKDAKTYSVEKLAQILEDSKGVK